MGNTLVILSTLCFYVIIWKIAVVGTGFSTGRRAAPPQPAEGLLSLFFKGIRVTNGDYHAQDKLVIPIAFKPLVSQYREIVNRKWIIRR